MSTYKTGASRPQDGIQAGFIATIRYPFVRDTFIEYTEGGSADLPSWKPGIEVVSAGQYGEVVDAIAHGEGEMTLSVVGVFKPGRFPTRVFYTRKFKNPDGKEFGKGKLHIATLGKFRRLARGFHYAYEVVPSSKQEASDD